MMKVTEMKAFFTEQKGFKEVEKAIYGKMLDIKMYCENERGALGIKEIAMIVAGIVIIGAVTSIITGKSSGWVDILWGKFIKLLDNIISPA